MNNSVYFFFHTIPLSLYACAGLIAGITLVELVAPTTAIIAVATLGLAAIFMCSPHNITHKYTLITLGFFLVGALRIQYQIQPYENFAFKDYLTPQSITGHITNISTGSNARAPKCITLYVPHIGMSIQLYTKRTTPGSIGDTITIHHVQLKKPNKSSYRNYLLKEGILCSLFLDNPDVTILHHPTYSLSRTVHAFKEQLLSGIKKKCTYGTFCLFSALFLGEKSRYKKYLEPLSDQFKEWGIVHFLARSGLHLVIFILLWELLCACIPIHFSHKQYLLVLITMIYFIHSWSSVSFLRALILFILCKYCALHYRPSHFLHTLSATCCIILIFNPMQLFFLDFQLTFSLTGALAWLSLR